MVTIIAPDYKVNLKECVVTTVFYNIENVHSSIVWLQLELQINSILYWESFVRESFRHLANILLLFPDESFLDKVSLNKGIAASVYFKETKYS